MLARLVWVLGCASILAAAAAPAVAQGQFIYRYKGNGISSPAETATGLVINLASGPIPAMKAHKAWTFDFGSLATTNNPDVDASDLAWADDTPALPGWLTLNANGSATATPPAAGPYTFELVASAPDPNDGNQIKEGRRTYTITVDENRLAVSQVAVGRFHSCAVVGGGAKCWGRNSNGQLGNNSTVNSSVPVGVEGLETGVSAIATGELHTCALMTSGRVKCWGSGAFGQLGNNTSGTTSSVPVDVQDSDGSLLSGASNLTAGGNTACVLVSGTVKCWGVIRVGADTSFKIRALNIISGASHVVTGYGHTCAVVSSGLQCMGNNSWGQLGNGGTSPSYNMTPVRNSDSSPLTGVSSADIGVEHACAVMTNGTVRCWGQGYMGELGHGVESSSYYPVTVQGITSGATALGLGDYHSCAIVSGGLKCWGISYFNGKADSSVAQDVPGLTSGVSSLAAYFGHICVGASGHAYCVGGNGSGQLGNGTTTDHYTLEYVREE